MDDIELKIDRTIKLVFRFLKDKKIYDKFLYEYKKYHGNVPLNIHINSVICDIRYMVVM